MESRRAEIIDYPEIQRGVEVALDAGDLSKVKGQLEHLLSLSDASRNASENLFLYRSLGRLYREIGMDDEALQAFSQAYAFDSRDRHVLEALTQASLQGFVVEEPMALYHRLLVHHRHSLKASLVANIYRSLAAQHQAQGQLEHAQAALEKALEASPGELEVINALLGIAEQSGDDDALLAVREKLLASLSNAESRAAVLVAMGDDYVRKLSDPARAVDAYERALSEFPDSQAALQRIAELSAHREDFGRAVAALRRLGELAEEADEFVKVLTQAANLAREQLKDLPLAATCYNLLLDRDPQHLDAFKALARMLMEQEDWPLLEQTYVRMVERYKRLPNAQTNVLVVLYRNLGELRAKRLDNLRGAAEAYQAASDLLPQDVAYHQLLGELYSHFSDTHNRAVEQYREVLRLAPAQLESVESLAALYLKMEKVDESLCLYRVLEALGRADDTGRALVERFHTPRPPKVEVPMLEEVWERFLRPDYLERSLLKIFSLAYPALVECFAHDLEHYNLREKDARLNLEERSFFSTIFSNVAKVMGLTALPPVFINPRQRGLRNAYLFPPALLVGPDLLAGRDEREIAFACAKALSLFRPEFYVCQVGGTKVLEGIVYTVFKTFRPDLNIKLSKEMLQISKVLQTKLKPTEQGALKSLVDEYLESGTNLILSLYLEAAEDTSNRAGLLFSDAPRTVFKVLESEEGPIGSRSPNDRFGSLLMWAIGEQYLQLRKHMNIAVH
ncbi:MAG: hypothetical protein RBU37_25725 [Myxococcota bacterium]|jgi:tetratricopeptide (TPR) repeat protein|nr:hypothetical protein [Myxococcota bacterium]